MHFERFAGFLCTCFPDKMIQNHAFKICSIKFDILYSPREYRVETGSSFRIAEKPRQV